LVPHYKLDSLNTLLLILNDTIEVRKRKCAETADADVVVAATAVVDASAGLVITEELMSITTEDVS